MKTLTLLTDDMDPRRGETDPLKFIMDNSDWLWTNLSTTPVAAGASPFFYWGPIDTRVLPANWTEFEIDEFAWLHRMRPIVLELEDDIYKQVIARIESRRIVSPS